MTPQSSSDLDTIVRYLSQFYPSTPARFIAAFEKTKINLSEMPYMYPVYEDMIPFRKAVVDKYLVFYTVADDRHLVQIHRILRGVWDIPQHLGER
ncbi:type II toxin-antitoxin system RelE/ParE family toxin [Breznakiellaceae bacterium SP9]